MASESNRPMPPPRKSRRWLIVIAALLAIAAVGVGVYLWMRPAPLPAPGSPQYEEYAEAFEVGTAALDADRFDLALENLTRAIETIPHEPAAWANRGLLYLRNNRLAEAADDLKKARTLAQDRPEIETLLGLLAEKQGTFDDAVRHLRNAVQRKPQDLAARYTLATLVEKAAAADADAEYQKLMEEILRVQPNNLKVLIERGKIAAQRRDAPALKDTLAQCQRLAPEWDANTRKQLAVVEAEAAKPLPGDVPFQLTTLNNLLQKELGYNRDAIAVNPNTVGDSLQQFIRLAPLRTFPDPPDTGMTFTPDPAVRWDAAVAKDRWDVCKAVWLSGEGPPVVFVANTQLVRRADGLAPVLPFPSGSAKVPPSSDGILAVDWNNDKRIDFLFAGAGGLTFWQQGQDGAFIDVTAKTDLDAATLGGDYFGAWAADIEMDGDLDIVLAPRSGPPIVLRNNGDSTFRVAKMFLGVEGPRAFVWADLDNDGAPDAAFLDGKGQLYFYVNNRAAQFQIRLAPKELGRLAALAVADVNDDGVFDLLALRDNGEVLRISDPNRGARKEVIPIGPYWKATNPPNLGTSSIFVADLDNNGMPDLIISGPGGTRIFLGEGPDEFTEFPTPITARVAAADVFEDNGRPDLVALSEAGQPLRLTNRGTKDYHWQAVRPFATTGDVRGDNRINSFGLGGEMELRAGTLIQKVPITSPRAHFGLGSRKKAQIVRIVWPNGFSQVEFVDARDRVVSAEQRLKASCPFLYAWNGKEIQFVTDFLWVSPLGMYINGQNNGACAQTQDWVKIRGDQLVPRDGYYDLRVNANLWETHFIDHMALIVIDHPADTEVFVDERFSLTQMVPQVYLTGPPKPVARALDHHGNDVTDVVRTIDSRYLDTCGRGKYQGITQDHWVEVDLGDDAPTAGPLWLLAHGWIHPTDSSINMAISQGKGIVPSPLVLEVPDGSGGWKPVGPPLGFPAGKNKTVMVRLDGIAGSGVARRFRLRTNMEIFWDALHYAVGLDPAGLRQQRLAPETADLRFRGIVEMTRANASSPELPHYDKLSTTGQRWRDLIGYHTRHGDVRELLARVDDRYVIINAGDELAMRFPVPDGPPPGWKRDFAWVADGWVKDGDYNTAFSKTVLPLPAHDQKSYDRPPGRLEDDPVFQRFPNDWKTYHTRWVTPLGFERGLRSFRGR